MKLDRDIKISTVSKDDYPEVEGQIVKVGIFDGIVIGCNRSIGVTVVEVGDKDHYLLCFPGPSSPEGIMEMMKEDMRIGGRTYDEVFNKTLRMIKSGGWKAGDLKRWVRNGDIDYSPTGCDGSMCAWKQ